MSRIVIVSNRVPLPSGNAGKAGGLAVALLGLMERRGGLWFGWSGAVTERADAPAFTQRGRIGYATIDLTEAEHRGYYTGYSNGVLWPMLHSLPHLMSFRRQDLETYRRVNRRFAEHLAPLIQQDDRVWVHDYQLMLVPALLRERVPGARIGFFLHIPFPSATAFRILPRREELLRGLLGADYLAFHTHSYLQHFRASMLRVLGLDSRMDRVEVGGRSVRLDALPIGIAPQEFTDLLDRDEETRRRLAEIRQRFEGRSLLLGVDRIDYTKGIPERLRTFGRLLRTSPHLRGRVVLLQVAVPSRELIPMYQELRQEIDELVGQINGEFSTPDWTPIIYLRRGIPRSELVALYAAADLAWVTPLRDGLNLVAKEYVACQREGAGALVLSEFAGAADELNDAFLVNPHDIDGLSRVMLRAAQVEPQDGARRMAALRSQVFGHDVTAWATEFLDALGSD